MEGWVNDDLTMAGCAACALLRGVWETSYHIAALSFIRAHLLSNQMVQLKTQRNLTYVVFWKHVSKLDNTALANVIREKLKLK